MSYDTLVKQVELLIKKAAETEIPDAALKLSQAANNAANAMAQLQHIEANKPK